MRGDKLSETNKFYIEKVLSEIAVAFDSPTCTHRWVQDAYHGASYIGDAWRLLIKTAVDARAAQMQVDDVLTVNWIGVKDGDYRQALNDLVTFSIQVHDDPAVSSLAKQRQDEHEELLRLRAAKIERLSDGC